MSKKCAYCGRSFEESQFEYNENTFCSEVCYNEMKFVMKGGDMVFLVIGYLFVGICATSFLSLLMYVFTCFMGIGIEAKLTPYVITSFFILLLSILSTKIQKPFRGIIKMFSSYGIPYWIVGIYHLYIYTYVTIFLMFGDLEKEIVQDRVDILGLKFNYFVANSLMVLSFISVIVVLSNKLKKLNTLKP